MQDIIMKILTEIKSRKQSANKVPTAPLLGEVKEEIIKYTLQELDDMRRAGILEIGPTINDKYITLK